MSYPEPAASQLRRDLLPLRGRVALVRRGFPQGLWGTPDDPARLIAWMATDEAAWMTGQTINTEGGYRR